MPTPLPATRLRRLWSEIRDLTSLEELLAWDQETYMPAAAAPGRARLAATLARIRHERLTAPELADSIARCQETLDSVEEPHLAADLRVARREVERARKIPLELAGAVAEASSRGGHLWQQARSENDFSAFAPVLEEILSLKRNVARCLAGSETGTGARGRVLYDELLDEYEPGFTCALLEPVFEELEARLSALVHEVTASGRVVDESVARGSYPENRQLEFARWACERLGFDFSRGRIDRSAHPFCLGINRNDVRFTWRHDESDFRSGLLAILHELGHGLYEQGLPEDGEQHPSGGFCSLGMHESQSRFWENQIGRSLGFWRGVLPRFRELFPKGPQSAEALWPSLHTVRPSLVRVEADEATYNLHIVIRYRLERRLLEGDLPVGDLPHAWSEAYRETLGIEPDTLSTGVLQDIHWSQGLFGYFPTYTVGTLASSQLRRAAERDLGDLEDAFERLEFEPVLHWMRQQVHAKGARFEASEILQQATASPLSAAPFLDEIEGHTERVYGISKGPRG